MIHNSQNSVEKLLAYIPKYNKSIRESKSDDLYPYKDPKEEIAQKKKAQEELDAVSKHVTPEKDID